MDNDNLNTQNKNITPTPPEGNGANYTQYIDPNYHQKQKKKKMLIIIASVAALVLLIVAVALAAALISSDKQDETTNSSEAEVTVRDCTQDEACFNDYFKLCQPARYETIEPIEDKVHYEVTGTQEVGCLVSIRYVESSDERLVGKEMTCDFDNELDFRESLELVNGYPKDHECIGGLMDYYNSVEAEVNSTYDI